MRTNRDTTVTSEAVEYFTTELKDVIHPRSENVSVWCGHVAGGGGMLGKTRSGLDPIRLDTFVGRVHYGTSPWSARGKGTLALPSAAAAADDDDAAQKSTPGWARSSNVYICGYPTCDPRTGPSKYPLKLLATNSTADECESACTKTESCSIWQLGSAGRGGKCQQVGDSEHPAPWTPIKSSGGRAAGCNVATVRGCGTTPPAT